MKQMSSSSSSKKHSHKPWKADFPYQVDYNDHFETPLQAYRDLQPLIDWILTTSSQHKKDPILYDPYYCNGQTKTMLQQSLGYKNVVHEKRDFYRDVANDTVPTHDLLVTNPPYSDKHKKKCIDYVFARLEHDNVPFALLLPTYVATKLYFRQALEDHGFLGHTASPRGHDDEAHSIVYLVPQQDYAYHHPEETGKDVPPFCSMWFCGLPRGKQAAVRTFWNRNHCQTSSKIHLYLNLAELEAAKVIKIQNRPNPKKRRKRQKQQTQQQTIEEPESVSATSAENDTTATTAPSSAKRKKNSKYRDESGQRKRRRF